MKKKSISLLIAVAMATSTLTPATVAFADTTSKIVRSAAEVKEVTEAPASTYGVTYDTHIEKRGWDKSVKVVTGDSIAVETMGDAGISGTIGRALRVEALKIEGTNLPEGASISYDVHQQSFGWSKVAKDGEIAGVTGKAKRAEAIRVTLKGMPGYAIKYQVHVQKKGWMDAVVTENGTELSEAKIAGTTGQGLRIEALRVQIVKTDAEKKAEIEAINAVAKAEATKDKLLKEEALEKVSKVEDSIVKAELTEKLDNLVIEDRVLADNIVAVSDTKISVAVTEGQEDIADKLKDSKIILTDSEGNELTATFAVLSEDGKTADYTIDEENKLVDAVTYTASSDVFEFNVDSFMARVASETYIKEVTEVTTKIVAGKTAEIYLQAKNQYGEEMEFDGKDDGIKVLVRKNGMPLLDSEVSISNGIITINKELKENDKLDLTVTNKIGEENVQVASISYVVGKEEEKVATAITNIVAKYSGVQANNHVIGEVAKEVMPDDEITLTPEIKDQFKNPMTGEEVRWVVEEGKDLITETSGSPIEVKRDAETLEFKAVKTGTLKISAYLENGEKFTYEVEIGAKQLQVLNLTENNTSINTYNLDENIIKEVTPNAGAILTPDMIKFDVKAGNDEVTAADVKVEAKLRGGKDESIKDDIVIVAKSYKAGTYKITPYVGESLEKATVKGDEITYTTTVDQEVASIDEVKFNEKELKTGKDLAKEIVFRNKHNEEVVLSSAKVKVTPDTGAKASVIKEEDKNILKINASVAKTYQVTISVEDVFASYKLTFAAPKLTTINAAGNITGTVAGDEESKAKYKEIKFLDQDKEAMDVKVNELKVKVTNSKKEEVTTSDLLTLGKKYSVDKVGQVTFEEASSSDNVVAIKVLPQTDLEEGIYTVTIEDAKNSKLADTFTVSVGAKRAVNTLDVKADETSVALDGKTVIRITPKDQYGEFFKLGAQNLEVEAKNCEVDSIQEDTNKDGDVIGYKVTLTGTEKGTANVKVSVVDNKKISNNVSVKVDSVGNLVANVTIDNTLLKDLYSTEKGNAKVALKAIAKDANNNVVPMSSNDLTWKVEAQKDAEGKDVTITATVNGNGELEVLQGTAGTVKVSVTTSNQKEAEIELNFSNEVAVAKAGTATLVNAAGDDKVVDADNTKEGIQVLLDGNGDKDGEADGTISFDVKAKDQYGEDFTVTTGVSAKTDDTSVVKVEVVGNTVKLTAKGAGTANVYITYNGDKIKLELTVTQAAVDAVTP